MTASSPEHLSADGQATNFLFYEKDNLTPDAHTLIMNITDLQNQAFILDFIVYSPSFSSFGTIPNLTTTPSPESVTSAATTSGPVSSTPNTTSGSTSIQSERSDSSNDVPVGTIVGGALGGLALLVIIGLALLYMRRPRSATALVQSPVLREQPLSGNENGE